MAFVVKDWQDRPPELDPLEGESLRAWFARIVAYDEQNPGVLNHLDAAAHVDLETRLSGYTDEQIAAMDLSAYATLASPVFTGSIGLPVYTLATRPAAAGQPRLVFISDAVAGTKLQWSDGTVWQSAVAVLNNLSADTSDKLIWNTAGGAIVELWGQKTAAGETLAQRDDANADNTGAYTTTGDGGGGIAWTGSTYIRASIFGGASSAMRLDWGLQPDTARVRVRGRSNSTFGGQTFSVGFGAAGFAHVMALSWDTAGHLILGTDNGGIDLGVFGAVGGTYYVLELTRAGNNFTATVYDDATGAVLHTFTQPLPAGAQATLGAGTMLYPYFGVYKSTTGGGEGEIDWFELDTVQPESHDLFVAVTPPSGGARTVRRLYGIQGTTSERTDFVLASQLAAFAPLASPNFTGSVGLPVYTLATRPAATVGQGKAIWVSDAAAGLRLQTSDGTSWNAHISGALLTTKGDLIAATGAGVPARVAAAGVAGNVLTEDPTVATGWKSAAPPAGGGGGGGGTPTGAALPAITGEGQEFILTSQPGNPTYKVVGGAWEQQPRMGAQTVPSAKVNLAATWNALPSGGAFISWTSELHDTDNMHDLVTNPDRITIKTPGLYLIEAGASIGGSNAGSRRSIIVIRNGWATVADQLAQHDGPIFAGRGTKLSAGAVVRLAAGDYLRLYADQDSGGNISVDAEGETFLSATWLGGAGQTVDERGVPAVLASLSASLTVPTATFTLVGFGAESYDTDSMHDGAVNNTRLTVKTPGLYRINVYAEWEGTAASNRIMRLLKNGAFVRDHYTGVPNSSAPLRDNGPSADIMLAAGDYVEVQAWQDSGASRQLSTCEMSAVLVGSGKTVTPYAFAYKAANDALIPSGGGEAAIPFTVEAADNDGIHDTTTNTTRLVCRTAGTYAITALATYSVVNNVVSWVTIRKNGTTLTGARVSGVQQRIPLAAVVELAVGDYIELWLVGQSGHGGITVIGNANTLTPGLGDIDVTTLQMVKVGAPNAGVLGGLAGAPPPASYAWPVIHNDVNDTYRTGAVKTFTAPTAGVYKLSLQGQFNAAAQYSYEERVWTITTTGTRLDNGGSGTDWGPDNSDGNAHSTLEAVFALAAGQTVTVQPQARAGAMNINAASWFFSMLAQYIGATHDDSQIT